MVKLAFIFLGSGIGGVLRYCVTVATDSVWHGALPLGTIIVNVTGCIAIGFLVAAMGGSLIRDDHRAALIIGLLGGYTTFSAFSRESVTLLQDGHWPTALLNIVLSNALGILGAWAGWFMATRMYPPHPA